jgi:hypothetical protein
VAHALVEFVREDTVPVMDEKSVPMVSRNRFAELLDGPLGRRMCRDIGMQNSARRVLHQDEDIEEAKGRCDHRAEIAGDNGLGVVTDKRPPALGRDAVVRTTVEALGHIFAYRPRRYPEAQLEQQFVGETLLAPRRVVAGHTANERLQVRGDGWSSRP